MTEFYPPPNTISRKVIKKMYFFNKSLLHVLLSMNIQLNNLNNNYFRLFLENTYEKKFQIKLLFVKTMSLIFIQKLWLKIEILYLIKNLISNQSNQKFQRLLYRKYHCNTA